jgi:predicted TIM-barrel fold metal-dependent hydrolase
MLAIRRRLLIAGSVLILACQPERDPPQPRRQPVIDMHLHAFGSDWVRFFKDTSWFPPGRVTDSDSLREQTLRLLAEHNIVKAVASGTDQAIIDRWRAAAPDRIVPALVLFHPFSIDSIRARVKRGSIGVLGEAVWQYQGMAPDDKRLEPYWALAEELDVPVGIHLGPGPPGVGREMPFRVRLGDPLLLEEVLTRHPRLRLFVMHAGWPMGDRMLALLTAFPQVYVDVALINTMLPRPEFHAYLRRLVDAGFGRNIMYGSDQAVWPTMIGPSLEAIKTAEFLSPEQKRDILCANAARFLRLEPSPCGG